MGRINFFDSEGTKTLWERVFTLLKKLTGDVRISTDGTLQEQLDRMKETGEELKEAVNKTNEKLDNSGKGIEVDSALSSTSENPVQNKVVSTALDSKANTNHTHAAQTSVTGNAGSATKLQTARTVQVNLASTAAATFDGTANIAPGVTGTLPVARGGTGLSASNPTVISSTAPSTTAVWVN